MFDQMCTKIVSPPKFRYSLYDLGGTVNKWGKRTDFHIHNHKNIKMNCSLYQPYQLQFQRACIVYLHSMNGSRLQGSVYVQRILKEGVSFCTFDFSGCGNSEGDKISFGANQKHDIEALISKLKESFYLNRFILWGRSMGSASAIKYSELTYDKSKTILSCQNEQIVGLILDSSFKSFSQLLVQIGHTQSEIPKFLIQAGFFIIKSTLQKIGEFKLNDLELITNSGSGNGSQKSPLEKLQSLNLPILFLASKQDKTVSYQHSVDMYEAYNCRSKELKYFKGLHNQSREEDYVFQVVTFIRKILNKEIKEIKPQNDTERIMTLQTVQYSSQFSQNAKTIKNQKAQKPRSSIMKLIEEQSLNEQTSTLFEFQTVQNTCVCTMFENEFVRHQSQSYRQREKSTHFKESKPLPPNQKQNCDQPIAKPNLNHSKVKKSISQISTINPIKPFQYHGPNFTQPNPSPYIIQPVTSPRSFKKLNQTMELKIKGMEQSIYTGMNKGKLKIFDELYTPLRVSSERSLRVNDSTKGQ